MALVAASVSTAVLVIADRDTPPPAPAVTADDQPSTPLPGPAKAGRSPQGEVSGNQEREPAPKPPASTPKSAPTPDPVPERGAGTFDTAPAVAGPTSGATTYRVEVERGMPFDADEVASFVEATLLDDRGWAARHALVRVDGESDLRVVIASPKTTDALCAPLDTGGRLSCRNGSDVVINAWRWQFGAKSYPDKVTSYRRYVVNHEMGHALGYGHVSCPGPGELAPVMVQQTKGLAGCIANPWPARVDLLGH